MSLLRDTVNWCNRVGRFLIIKPCLIAIVSLMITSCSSMVEIAPSSTGQGTAAKTGTVAVDKLMIKGDQQRRKGQLAAASATLERALRLSPRSPAVYVALARVKLDAGLLASAKQFAQKALSLLPSQSSWKLDRVRAEAQWVIGESEKRH